MKTNINLFEHSKKLFYTVMDEQYETHRRGYIDFPSKSKWLNQQWELFKSNNPKLLGLTYDPTSKDWFHEHEGGIVRTIINS